MKSVAVLLVCATAGLSAQAGTVTYYHNDLAGSPIVATNSSGSVVWRESYRPYGERLANSAAASGNKIWFTSRRQDPETGLVYMGARYYDPLLGRFVSMDPKQFDEANEHSFNRYAYANDNPYRYIDPDGEQAFPLWAASPPPTVPTQVPTGVLGKPSEVQQLRALEGLNSSTVNVTLPSFEAEDALNFLIGGFAGISAGKVSNLIFNSNPFAGPVDGPVVIVDSKGNLISDKPQPCE